MYKVQMPKTLRLVKGLEKKLNKWRDGPSSWIGRLTVTEVSVLLISTVEGVSLCLVCTMSIFSAGLISRGPDLLMFTSFFLRDPPMEGALQMVVSILTS
jgi:hypothetical protein